MVGTPHERRGQRVTTIVTLRSAASGHLAVYKLPKASVRLETLMRSTSVTVDSPSARTAAVELDSARDPIAESADAGGLRRCEAYLRIRARPMRANPNTPEPSSSSRPGSGMK